MVRRRGGYIAHRGIRPDAAVNARAFTIICELLRDRFHLSCSFLSKLLGRRETLCPRLKKRKRRRWILLIPPAASFVDVYVG